MTGFTHLHLHTQYSLLDGAIRLEHLFPRLQELGYDTVAITDHGNMFGAIDFYRRAKKAGIKPIIGCEVYVAGSSRHDRSRREAYHLVLLAKDEAGYRNLCRLVSYGYLEGFYYNPRIDLELLKKYSPGLIGLSACLSGEIAHRLVENNFDGALAAAQKYADCFAPGDFYIEVQKNGLADQEKANPGLVEIARRLKIPLVATNDCHYLRAEDYRAHDILLCISTGKTLNDENRMRHESREFYLRSPQEMESLFADLPEALENTVRIARACQLELKLGQVNLPLYRVPEGYDLDSFLTAKAQEGLMKRLEGKSPAEQQRYRERLEHELGIIRKMGFSGYFLIVWDFISFARSQAIPVGPGRGSGAGSLVAYSLGITDIDPLAYDLLFERFLNPDRVSMPDFDIDFCQDRRGEVIQYVTQKYGADRVAQIITFGQLKARLAIKDVGRVLGLSFAETDRVSKLVPAGPNVTLDEAYQAEPRLKQVLDEKPVYREMFEVARSLEGLNRQSGTHAAGIVISNQPLIDVVPVLRGEDGVLVTQFAKDEVEQAGLVKFDFLGLKTLTVIEHALQLIRRGGRELDIRNIPLDDPKVYRLLSSGDTDGVFQLESEGFKQLLKELRPDRFEDIIAAVALYRPGPLGAGMVEDYIRRKRGGRVTYPHPVLEGALSSTYGVIIYQEQVMRIAVDLSGFTLSQADTLRKAMGKKKADEMAKLKQKFIQGAQEKSGMPAAEATELFEKIEKFAEYAFNKSHSAAYALISYRTAYLKAHFPVEFMAALLSSELEDSDKIKRHLTRVREMSITVLPPDINRSEKNFSVEGQKIVFGLGAIKGLGDAAIQAVVEARRDKPFSSFYDFLQRVDLQKLNKRVLEALIASGALDGFGCSRAALAACLDQFLARVQQRQRERQSRQCSLLDQLTGNSGWCEEEPQVPQMLEWPERERLERERQVLGFCLSGHPLERFRSLLRKVANCTTAGLQQNGRKEIKLAAVVTVLRERALKNGSGRMATLVLEDLDGSCEAVVFSKEYAQCEELLKSGQPLLFSGSVSCEDEENQTYRILVRAVQPLGDLCQQNTSQVRFSVKADELSQERLQALKAVLESLPGKCSTYLCIQVPPSGAEVVLQLQQQVAWSENLEQEVNRLFAHRVTQVS